VGNFAGQRSRKPRQRQWVYSAYMARTRRVTHAGQASLKVPPSAERKDST
jgi:hypothetical protein